jgi:CMP-2-keto-3-deoxyoctulosonic acid synthetase
MTITKNQLISKIAHRLTTIKPEMRPVLLDKLDAVGEDEHFMIYVNVISSDDNSMFYFSKTYMPYSTQVTQFDSLCENKLMLFTKLLFSDVVQTTEQHGTVYSFQNSNGAFDFINVINTLNLYFNSVVQNT